METLIILVTQLNGIYLMDSAGFTLGSFATIPEAEWWCRDNGYRWRIQRERAAQNLERVRLERQDCDSAREGWPY